jgi:hypothetical protein
MSLFSASRSPSGEAPMPVPPNMPDRDVEGLLDIPNNLFPEATLINVVTVLRRDPRFVGRLSYDLDRSQTLLDHKPLTEVAATGLNVDIASAYDLHATTALVAEAARFVARDHSYSLPEEEHQQEGTSR